LPVSQPTDGNESQLRIDTNSRTTGIGYRGASGPASSGQGFSIDGEAPAGRAAATAPIASATSIDALLALQAVEDPLFARKKAIRRGHALLDTLDEMKADLLVGRVSEGRLNQLMALVGQAREQSLSGLDSLLDDIELRVRVELAKFGRIAGA
jgi:hypothetical protein